MDVTNVDETGPLDRPVVVHSDRQQPPLDKMGEENLQILLKAFAEIEIHVENHKEILADVAQKGDLKIGRWTLKFGASLRLYLGAIITIPKKGGGEHVEVFSHDDVFEYYGFGQRGATGALPFLTEQIDPQHQLLKDATTVQGTQDSWLYYMCMRFQAEVCRGVKGANRYLRRTLENLMTSLLLKCGGEPGQVKEEGQVDDTKNPNRIKALWRELPPSALAAIAANLDQTKIKIQRFFKDVAEWIGKNKYELVSSLAAGGLAAGGLAAASAFSKMPLPVIGIIATFLVGAAAAAGLVVLVKKAICKGLKKEE